MTKLRVGNVEIDGTSVRIGGEMVVGSGVGRSAAAPAQGVRATPAGNADSGITAVTRVPGPPVLLVSAGALLIGVGVVAMVLVDATRDPVSAFLQGGALAPVGLSLVAVGTLKAWVRRSAGRWAALRLGAERTATSELLRTLLQRSEPSHTLAWIRRETGWPEATAVATLAWLRERGELEEELDETTGEFYYHVPPRARDLATRVHDLQRGL